MDSLSTFSKLMVDTLKKFKEQLYKESPFDKTIKGIVTEEINPYKYKVLVNGQSRIVSSVVKCNINDYVWIKIPCNNMHNMFIEYKTRNQ